MYLGYECVDYHSDSSFKCTDHCKHQISKQLARMREDNLRLAHRLKNSSKWNPLRRRRNRKIAEEIQYNCSFIYELNLGPY